MIQGDPTSINQIVMNLCTNAYHAMEAGGGTLEVMLDEVKIGINELLSFPELAAGNYVHISVIDTGQGIEKENMVKIFDPFFTTKRESKGTGLGLAMVYRIVQDYCGTIKEKSEVGVGTEFDVYIPKLEGKSRQIADKKETPVQEGNGNILLVDDEKPLLDAIEMSLILLGYNVTAYENSVMAFDAFKNNPDDFDIVMTDLTMPNLTGEELAENVHSIRSDLPIIIASGENILRKA
jgi:hypothetical protein